LSVKSCLVVVLVVSCAGASPLLAQTPAPLVNTFPRIEQPSLPPDITLPALEEPAPPARERRATGRAAMPGMAEPFRQYVGDLGRFISADTFRVVGVGGSLALAAHHWDGHTMTEAREHLGSQTGLFAAGNIGGQFVLQAGVGYATMAIGKATGEAKVAWLGADLVRAQLLSQTIVQGLKYSAGRTRPDGSNDLSFPSGHTATATATASVLQRYFGWKAGVPAYAFAAYVGSARIASDKHHLSDVMMGAAIGIAAGRTVTLGLAREKFDVGITPTVGGAAVMFTRR
jgi:hypothetical protein